MKNARSVRADLHALIAAFLCCVPSAWGIEAGQSLDSALHELERSGLTLLRSSALVTPALRVEQVPPRGAPEQVARSLLAAHGLALQPIRPGTFAVVRAPVPPPGTESRQEPPVDSQPIEEIAVFASRYRVNPQPRAGAAELTREDIEALPGLDQDVLRVTKYLPGTATNGVSSRPYVRGGRQNELAVYYDGVPLFEPFHFKDFQGLLGVLDPAVVGSLDFYSGVPPARVGDRLSGVLDIVPRAADSYDTWIFGLSPLYASAITSGRYDARRIEWLAAARTSTIGLVLSELDARIGDPDFTDALGRLEMPVGERGRVIVGWMLLDDSLDFSDDEETARASYRDGTSWLRGELEAGAWRLGSALSHTERHTTRRGSITRDTAVGDVDDVRRHDATTLRVEAVRPHARGELVSGIEAQYYESEYEYRGAATFEPHFAAAFGRPDTMSFARELALAGEAYAAYLFETWQASDALTLSAGLRWDAQRYDGFRDDELSPRFAAEWRVAPGWRLRAAAGRTHQTQRPDELQVQDGEDFFHPAQRADQLVLSVEHDIARDWEVRVEAFNKHIADPMAIYENLLDALVVLPELEVDRARVAPESSTSYGVETTLRWQPAERWSGWMTYSWTEAEDGFPGRKVARTWDQRNAVNAGLSWTRRPWQLSGTVQWRTGWRRNELTLVDATTGELLLAPRNSLKYPNTMSVDLRATWTYPLPASALHFYVDVGNAGDRQTPCCTSYTLTEDAGLWSLDRELDSTLPRYALLGVNWEMP